MQNFFAEIVDVVFNGRSAADATGEASKRSPQVSWPELIRRKKSYVRIGSKTYRVTVEKVKLSAEPQPAPEGAE